MRDWQAKVGFWGTLAWLGLFRVGEFLLENHYNELALAVFGYTMGFITVFAGHLFWGRIIRRRWDELLGNGWFERVTAACSLSVIMVFGAVGFWNGIFNSNAWFYSLFFALGGFVINQGVMPIIDHIDTKNK